MKPIVSDQVLAALHDPQQPIVVHMERFTDAKGLPRRLALGWWLRHLADKIDGGMSYTYRVWVKPNVPISPKDTDDATVYGVTAITRFLNDLIADRSIK